MSARGKRNWKDSEESQEFPSHLSLREEDYDEEADSESGLAVVIPAHQLSRDRLYEYLDFLELVYESPTKLHIYKTGVAQVSIEITLQKSYIGFKVAGWLYKISWSIYQKTSRGRP